MTTAKYECELLLGEVLPLARRLLAEQGEFYPFGAIMENDGRIVSVAVAEEGSDRPLPSKLVEHIWQDFARRAAASTIKAVALVFEVTLRKDNEGESRDAIQVCLEHRAGYCALVFSPFALDVDGNTHFEELFSQQGQARVFL